MNEKLKVPIVVVAVVGVVVLLLVLGSKAMSAGDLDQGQIKYTPGVPPWEEKGNAGMPAGPSEINNSGN